MAEEENEIQVVRDWDFDVNLSGLQAPTGKGGNKLPTGYYRVLITDMYINPERNANRVIIKYEVAEGPFMGIVRTDGMNRPQSGEDNVRYYWRGLAESCGYEPAALDNGEVSLGLGTFQGKTAHVLFTDKEDHESGYERTGYLPPMEWAQQKQNFEMTGGVKKEEPVQGASGSALGGAPPISKPKGLGGNAGGNPGSLGGGGGGGGGGEATKRSALLSKLGVQ